jgi:hypothetical protein
MRAPLTASRRVLAGAVVALMLPLTACGSQQAGGGAATYSPGRILNAAEAKAVLDGASSGLQSVHVSFAMGTEPYVVKGEVDTALAGDTVRSHMTVVDPSAGTMELIRVGSDVYVKADAGGKTLGGKWLKVSLAHASTPLARNLEALTAVSPTQLVHQFEGGLTGGTFIGSDPDGDKYEFTVDSAKALKNLPASLADIENIKKAMANLPASLKLNVWTKGDRLTKVTIDLGQGGIETLLISRHGEAVSIQAPPIAEVTTAASVK